MYSINYRKVVNLYKYIEYEDMFVTDVRFYGMKHRKACIAVRMGTPYHGFCDKVVSIIKRLSE